MMSLEQWEKLYTYAEELWKLAPWKKIDDIELIGLQNGKKNDAVWVSTLGYHDSTYGAAFYQGVENLKGWYMIINQEEYGLDQMFTIFSQNMLTLYYGEKKEIPPQQEEILHSLKKKYKDGRIPYFYSMKECSVPVEPDDEELAQLLAWLPLYIDACKHFVNEAASAYDQNKCMVRKVKTDGTVTYTKEKMPRDLSDPLVPCIDEAYYKSLEKKVKQTSDVLEVDMNYLGIPTEEGENGEVLERPLNPIVTIIAEEETGLIYSYCLSASLKEAVENTTWELANVIEQHGIPKYVKIRHAFADAAVQDVCDHFYIFEKFTDRLPAIDDVYNEFFEKMSSVSEEAEKDEPGQMLS